MPRPAHVVAFPPRRDRGSNDDCSGSSAPGRRLHLRLRDLAVLSLVPRDELVERAKAPIVIGLAPQRPVDPGAEAVGATIRDRRTSGGEEVRFDCGR